MQCTARRGCRRGGCTTVTVSLYIGSRPNRFDILYNMKPAIAALIPPSLDKPSALPSNTMQLLT